MFSSTHATKTKTIMCEKNGKYYLKHNSLSEVVLYSDQYFIAFYEIKKLKT